MDHSVMMGVEAVDHGFGWQEGICISQFLTGSSHCYDSHSNREDLFKVIRHLIAGAKRAFGLHKPGRQLDVFPDDIFLVPTPNRATRGLVFWWPNLVYPDKQVDFANINDLTPDPEALTKRHLARMPRPRIIKSHQYFDPCYRRVIYIVRDPRDVLLSDTTST